MMASTDADDDKKMPPSMELESTETGGAGGAGAGAGGGAKKMPPSMELESTETDGAGAGAGGANEVSTAVVVLKGSTEFEQWDNRADSKGGTATDQGFPERTLAAEMFQGFQGDDGAKAKQTLDFVEDFLLLDVDQRILAIRMFQEYPGDEATKVEETAKFVKGLLAKHEITGKISPEVREAYMSQHWGHDWTTFRRSLMDRTYIVHDGKFMWKVQKQGEAKKNVKNNPGSKLVEGEVYVPVPETRRLLYDGLKAEVQRRFPKRALKRDHLDTVRKEVNIGLVPFGVKNGGAIMALEANSKEFEAADEAYFGSKAPNNLQQDKPVLDTPLRPRSDGGLAAGGGDVAAGGAGGGTPDSYDSGMAELKYEMAIADMEFEIQEEVDQKIQKSAAAVKSHYDGADAAGKADQIKAENVEQDLMAGQKKNEEEYFAILKGLNASRGDMSNRILKNQAVRLQGREETRQQGIQAIQSAHSNVAASAQKLGDAKKKKMQAQLTFLYKSATKKVKKAANKAMNSPKVLLNKTPSRRKAVTSNRRKSATSNSDDAKQPVAQHSDGNTCYHSPMRAGVEDTSREGTANDKFGSTPGANKASVKKQAPTGGQNLAAASTTTGAVFSPQQVQSPTASVEPTPKKGWNPIRRFGPSFLSPAPAPRREEDSLDEFGTPKETEDSLVSPTSGAKNQQQTGPSVAFVDQAAPSSQAKAVPSSVDLEKGDDGSVVSNLTMPISPVGFTNAKKATAPDVDPKLEGEKDATLEKSTAASETVATSKTTLSPIKDEVHVSVSGSATKPAPTEKSKTTGATKESDDVPGLEGEQTTTPPFRLPSSGDNGNSNPGLVTTPAKAAAAAATAPSGLADQEENEAAHDNDWLRMRGLSQDTTEGKTLVTSDLAEESTAAKKTVVAKEPPAPRVEAGNDSPAAKLTKKAEVTTVTAGSTETPPKQKQKKISAKSPIPQAVAAVKKFFSPKANPVGESQTGDEGEARPVKLTKEQRKQRKKEQQRADSARAKKSMAYMTLGKSKKPVPSVAVEDTKEQEEDNNRITEEEYNDGNLFRQFGPKEKAEEGLFVAVMKTEDGSVHYYTGVVEKKGRWPIVRCSETSTIQSERGKMKYDIKANAAAGRHAA